IASRLAMAAVSSLEPFSTTTISNDRPRSRRPVATSRTASSSIPASLWAGRTTVRARGTPVGYRPRGPRRTPAPTPHRRPDGADAPPRDGVVGSLWLVGSGDPTLATPEYAQWLKDRPRYQLRQATPLAALADGLAAAGVHGVTGGIVGDDSRYDRARTVPTWKP